MNSERFGYPNGVIRNRGYPKGVIRSRKLKKDGQYNGPNNDDLHNTKQKNKTKEWATLKPGGRGVSCREGSFLAGGEYPGGRGVSRWEGSTPVL
jgi:hypothetical protein